MTTLSTLKVLTALSLTFLTLFSGCRRSPEGKTEEGITQPEEISGYGITLTRESTPEEVAQLLIKGLDNKDTGLLKQLVAVKYETEAVDAIYSKYGKKSSVTPEKAAGLAVAGWQATYAFFKAGQTTITKTEVQGDTATVYATAKGVTNLENRYIRINLVREDNWWKATAGIKE
jgi:hypothetical protein